MRTYVRVRRGGHPARRSGRVLRVGRATRQPSPARASGDRRGGSGARGLLRGQGVRCPHRDGRRGGPPAVPPSRRRRAEDVGLLRGEQGGLSRSSSRHRRWSRDCRSTRRSWTPGGWSGSRARPRRSPCACAARSSSGSACPSRWGWPGRSSSPRSPAAWPSPTACSWCRPRAETDLPPPSSRRAAVGRRRGHGQEASRPGDRDRRTRRPTRRGDADLDPRAGVGPPPSRARAPPRSAAGAAEAGAGARSGPSARSAGQRARRARWTRSSSRLVDRLARRLRAAQRLCRTVVLRLRFADYSRATRSHTLSQATAETEAILAAARALLAAGHADHREGRSHDDRRGPRQPPGRRRHPARAALRTPARRGPRRGARRGARPVRRRRHHASRAAGARPGPRPAPTRLERHVESPHPGHVAACAPSAYGEETWPPGTMSAGWRLRCPRPASASRATGFSGGCRTSCSSGSALCAGPIWKRSVTTCRTGRFSAPASSTSWPRRHCSPTIQVSSSRLRISTATRRSWCDLDRIAVADLEEVVVEAWLARAPKRLAQAYVDESR